MCQEKRPDGQARTGISRETIAEPGTTNSVAVKAGMIRVQFRSLELCATVIVFATEPKALTAARIISVIVKV